MVPPLAPSTPGHPAETVEPPSKHVMPTYLMPHPAFGAAGAMEIYRFDNDLGLVAERHLMRDVGWLVTPVRFTGVEVTSYVPDGDPVPNVSRGDLDKMAMSRGHAGKRGKHDDDRLIHHGQMESPVAPVAPKPTDKDIKEAGDRKVAEQALKEEQEAEERYRREQAAKDVGVPPKSTKA
jgi:hypothetical protein